MSKRELVVQFEESRGIVIPLEVRAPRGVVSVEELQAVLFALRVQIVHAEELELEESAHTVQRLAVCEFDGGPLRMARQRVVAQSVEFALSADRAALKPGLAVTAPLRARRAA